MNSGTAVTEKHGSAQAAESNAVLKVAERKALHEWLAASGEWSRVNRGGYSRDVLLCERQKMLMSVEKRVNRAADAYDQVRYGLGMVVVE